MQNSAGIILVIILCLVGVFNQAVEEFGGFWPIITVCILLVCIVGGFILWLIYEGKTWERFELERERTLTGDREQADRLKRELAETLVRVQELRRELEQERGRTQELERKLAKKESTFSSGIKSKNTEYNIPNAD